MTASFDIRNSAFSISQADIGKEHADTFRRDLHPDLGADYVLANPPFNDSDTALRDSAFLQSEAKPQVVSEAKDNFRKDDDVRWQPSGARQIAKGNPQGERGGVHQFGVPPKTAMRDSARHHPEGFLRVVSEEKDNNANFAWVQHFIHHLAPDGMAGFVLANGSMSSNQSGEGDNRTPLSPPAGISSSYMTSISD